MNCASISKSEVVNNELADCLQETQWVVENIIRDLRVRAELFGKFKRYRALAASLNIDADLLNEAWRRLKWQLCPNPILTSQSTGTRS